MSRPSAESVAAIIVLYRPDADVLRNIGSVAGQVDRIFAVDNTEAPDPAFLAALDRVPDLEYVPMGGNTGIAAALNAGMEHVRFAGYRWALTLDQDSTPGPRMVAALLRCAAACGSLKPVGVLAPVHQIEEGPASEAFDGCREELTVITSGDLLSVEAWGAVDGFDETLFIDQVDHDLCLRLHKAGYAVLTCGRAAMVHRMGEMARRRLRGPVYVSNHSALRRYYITRNRLAVTHRWGGEFPDFRDREKRAMRNELLKVVLYEDHKFAKLLMSWRGYRDYRRGVTGPYPLGPTR
jgi:rhamnosyltransferase